MINFSLKIGRAILLAIIGMAILAAPIYAQQVDQVETRLLEGTITDVISTERITVQDQTQLIQKLELLVTSGNEKGKTIQVDAGGASTVQEVAYEVGDKVQILAGLDPQG